MSGVIQLPISEASAGGGNTFIQSLLTPDSTVFHDPLVYFGNTATTWRAVNWDSGVLGTASGAIFSQTPFAMFLNEAQTELWAFEGSTTATQVLQKITIATNTQVSLTTITGIDANEIIYVAAIHPITGAAYVATRRLPEADGLLCLYSFNTTTAVATKIGESSTFLSTSSNGMSIAPDGTALLYTAPSGVPQIHQIDLTTAECTLLYTNAASSPWGFESLCITPRNTIIGTHVSFSGLSECGRNYGFIRACTIGGATVNVNVMAAPINRKFYLGMRIIKQLEVDSTGAIVDTKYFLGDDGDDVTAEIAAYPIQPFPFLPYVSVPDNASEVISANSTTGTLAFGSVVTASFATLVTVSSTFLPAVALKINNELNVPVYVTWDNFTNDLYVGAGEIMILDLPPDHRTIVNNIRVKAIGANAASGSIYGSLLY